MSAAITAAPSSPITIATRRARDMAVSGGRERATPERPRRGGPLGPRRARGRTLDAACGLGALALGLDPALLTGNLLALLDHRHVDEARERVAEQIEVSLPVARRQGPELHLLDRQRERDAVALAGGELELGQDGGAAQARGPRHVDRYLNVTSYCSR
jgi:hypothetical protein